MPNNYFPFADNSGLVIDRENTITIFCASPDEFNRLVNLLNTAGFWWYVGKKTLPLNTYHRYGAFITSGNMLRIDFVK